MFIIRTHHAPVEGDTTVSTTVVRAANLSYVRHRVKATGDSAAGTATSNHLTGWVDLPPDPVRLIDIDLSAPVFPVEGQIPWLMPLLPFQDGYRAVVSHFSEWSGGETFQSFEVLGSETIEFEDGASECWKVDTGPLGPPGYRGTVWIEKETRRILQSALLNPDGGPEYWAVAR